MDLVLDLTGWPTGSDGPACVTAAPGLFDKGEPVEKPRSPPAWQAAAARAGLRAVEDGRTRGVKVVWFYDPAGRSIGWWCPRSGSGRFCGAGRLPGMPVAPFGGDPFRVVGLFAERLRLVGPAPAAGRLFGG